MMDRNSFNNIIYAHRVKTLFVREYNIINPGYFFLIQWLWLFSLFKKKNTTQRNKHASLELSSDTVGAQIIKSQYSRCFYTLKYCSIFENFLCRPFYRYRRVKFYKQIGSIFLSRSINQGLNEILYLKCKCWANKNKYK